MSENESRNFSQYDSMATEDLQQLLRQDMDTNSGSEPDTERLLYIMALLADREKNSQAPGSTPQQAWESFQQHYLPDKSVRSGNNSTNRGWFRRTAAIAATLLLVISIPIAAVALDWSWIFNSASIRSEDNFSFVAGEEQTPTEASSPLYNSLQEAIEGCGYSCDFLPTWIPAGYELYEITVNETPMRNTYDAVYQNGDDAITIFAETYLFSDPGIFEFSGEFLETYAVKGMQCHIFQNAESICAAWMSDTHECHISGCSSVEQLKQMLDSIG